jgi:hypothetical protein
VAERGHSNQRHGRYVTVTEECRDGDDAEPECKEARMEIRFERVRARSRNVVAKRHGGSKREHEPPGRRARALRCQPVDRPTDKHDADPHDRHRDQVGREEPRFQRHAGRTTDPSQEFVDDEELGMRADERRVVREGGRILRQHDRGYIPGLVGHPEAVSRAIRCRENQKDRKTDDEQ